MQCHFWSRYCRALKRKLISIWAQKSMKAISWHVSSSMPILELENIRFYFSASYKFSKHTKIRGENYITAICSLMRYLNKFVNIFHALSIFVTSCSLHTLTHISTQIKCSVGKKIKYFWMLFLARLSVFLRQIVKSISLTHTLARSPAFLLLLFSWWCLFKRNALSNLINGVRGDDDTSLMPAAFLSPRIMINPLFRTRNVYARWGPFPQGLTFTIPSSWYENVYKSLALTHAPLLVQLMPVHFLNLSNGLY